MEEEYDWLEYEEQDEPGPVGVRPLLEYCQGVMMRCATRYDNVGSLRYHQHPLLFETMDPVQLAEIEDNSPSLQDDTDHLWKGFVQKKDPDGFKAICVSKKPSRSWRRVYIKMLKHEAERKANAVYHMRALYEAEQSRKTSRVVQMVDVRPDTSTSRRRSGPSNSTPKPKTLMEKIKLQSKEERGLYGSAPVNTSQQRIQQRPRVLPVNPLKSSPAKPTAPSQTSASGTPSGHDFFAHGGSNVGSFKPRAFAIQRKTVKPTNDHSQTLPKDAKQSDVDPGNPAVSSSTHSNTQADSDPPPPPPPPVFKRPSSGPPRLFISKKRRTGP